MEEMKNTLLKELKQRNKEAKEYLEHFAKEENTNFAQITKGNFINDLDTSRAYDLATYELTNYIINKLTKTL